MSLCEAPRVLAGSSETAEAVVRCRQTPASDGCGAVLCAPQCREPGRLLAACFSADVIVLLQVVLPGNETASPYRSCPVLQ